jgi:23S rRNA G2445 N2-methylase RlmL
VEVTWQRASVRDLALEGEGSFIVTNPPYGERLAASAELYRDMARSFGRQRGSTIAILAGTPDIERAMGGRPERALVVYNGDIECRLLVYRIA